MAVSFTSALADEYRQLFASARVRPERLAQVDSLVDKIFAPQRLSRYQAVEAKTGVPAFVIGIIHSLEAGLRFDGHLHNGDPLAARTVQVPKGRPKTGQPPFTWEESAIDALTFDGFATWSDWSVAGLAYKFESFNGMGYRLHHPEVKSPYLWSFTTIYTAGKYVADGKFSPTAVSQQVGAMALVKRIGERNLIPLGGAAPHAAPAVDTPPAEPAFFVSSPATLPYPGQPLRVGDSGAHVVAIQQRLTALSILNGAVDGDFGGITASAVRLFQARSASASGEPLLIDGVVGRQTWQALFGEVSDVPANPAAPTPLLKAVVDIAIGEIGVLEQPPGSNRGPEVDAYLNAVGQGLLGEPWCMAFVYWCFGRAAADLGRANPAPRTASVWRSWELAPGITGARIISAADARRDPTLIVPGAVFYIDTGERHGHAGFVTGFADGKLVTCEGNTTLKSGSREGIGVFSRTARTIGSINLGFVVFG